MASFSLPPINSNPDGSWGPSSSNLPKNYKFKDIPYAPYSKSDKLGRFADWNDFSGDNRQANAGISAPNARQGGRGRRDGAQAFGSGAQSAFAFQVEDESSFSLVDNKTSAPRRGGGFARGRGAARGGAWNARAPQRPSRGGFNAGRGGGGQRGGRRNWRDWDKVCITLLVILDNFLELSICRTIVLASHRLPSIRAGTCWRRSNSTVSRS